MGESMEDLAGRGVFGCWRVQERRAALGLSVRELAKASRVGERRIREMETYAQAVAPRSAEVGGLARALGVPEWSISSPWSSDRCTRVGPDGELMTVQQSGSCDEESAMLVLPDGSRMSMREFASRRDEPRD